MKKFVKYILIIIVINIIIIIFSVYLTPSININALQNKLIKEEDIKFNITSILKLYEEDKIILNVISS